MSIIVNGTKVKNVVFNGKNALFVKNKTPTTIFAKAGVMWTQSNITSGYFSEVVYANGLWVAGSGSSNSTGLYYSEDGKTWTQSNITSGYFPVIVYANGLWVASKSMGYSTGLYYSEYGKTWTRSKSGVFSEVVYANGLWVAVGVTKSTGLYYSE